MDLYALIIIVTLIIKVAALAGLAVLTVKTW